LSVSTDKPVVLPLLLTKLRQSFLMDGDETQLNYLLPVLD